MKCKFRAGLRLLVLAAVVGCFRTPDCGATSAEVDPITQVELGRIAAEILEAIRIGDKTLLAKHLAPDLVLINRDGLEYSRENLLDELGPPREGYDLRFTIRDPRVIQHGDSALFTFLLDEYLTIFGHNASTVYRNHFLFHRLDGAWKLAVYTYWEKPSTPPVVARDPGELDDFVGTYALVPGKWITHITRKGDVLEYQREGGKLQSFLPMAGDRFYLAGVEAEYFFERGPDGRVVALVFRRNWIDLRLARVP
jgi:hypothetical protein